MRLLQSAVKIFTAAVVCLTILPSHAITAIRITDNGAILFQSEPLIIDGTVDTISASVGFDNSVQVSSSFEDWTFTFDNIGDGPLLEGVYEGATRYPFQSATRPGLEASGAGAGCNTLNGRFAVLEIVYGAVGEIVSFAADLSLSCDEGTGVFRANIRVNSDLPLILEQPTASAGSDRIELERRVVSLDGSRSTGGNSIIASYEWTQIDGPTVELDSTTISQPSFETPSVMGEPVLLTFEVNVVNENGLDDSDVVSIEVRDRSAPRSFISFTSDDDHVLGFGDRGFLTEVDGVFTGALGGEGLQPFGNEANVVFSGSEEWDVTFVGDTGALLTSDTDYVVDFRVSLPNFIILRNNRICASNDGSFRINTITRDPGTNNLGSLSASFEQTCNQTDGVMEGSIRYQSVLPEANAGPDRAEPERDPIALDPSESVDLAGSIVSYEWTQTSGPVVSLELNNTNMASFTYELGDEELEQIFDFQLVVTDEVGHIDTDQLTLTVVQNNQPPVVADDEVNVQQGFAATFQALANDMDVDGEIDTSRTRIIDEPSEGSLVTNNNDFIYIPPLTFSGVTTATYVTYDNDNAESNIGTITFRVQAGPLGVFDSATTDTGVPVTFDILANDQAADTPLDPTTLVILQPPRNGTLSVNGDGTVTYTSAATFFGSDSFRYDVADGDGLRTPGTFVSISVTTPAGQQPPAPPAPPAPPMPPPEPPVAPPEQQQSSCSEPNPLTGRPQACGSGSLSPLSFLILGFALIRVRRRMRASVTR